MFCFKQSCHFYCGDWVPRVSFPNISIGSPWRVDVGSFLSERKMIIRCWSPSSCSISVAVDMAKTSARKTILSWTEKRHFWTGERALVGYLTYVCAPTPILNSQCSAGEHFPQGLQSHSIGLCLSCNWHHKYLSNVWAPELWLAGPFCSRTRRARLA